MIKSNVKSLIIILLIVIITISFQKSVLAANDDGLAGLLLDENTTLGSSTENTDLGNLTGTVIGGNTVTGSDTNQPVITPPVLNTATATNSNVNDLPKTGESDIYVVMLLIVIFAIVTIYSYKKVKQYNEL